MSPNLISRWIIEWIFGEIVFICIYLMIIVFQFYDYFPNTSNESVLVGDITLLNSRTHLTMHLSTHLTKGTLRSYCLESRPLLYPPDSVSLLLASSGNLARNLKNVTWIFNIAVSMVYNWNWVGNNSIIKTVPNMKHQISSH